MDENSLSPEFLEKAKACTSKEEFAELVASEGVELTDEVLAGVAGGFMGIDTSNCTLYSDCPSDDECPTLCAAYVCNYAPEDWGPCPALGYGDARHDIDPAQAPASYRNGEIGYAGLDW